MDRLISMILRRVLMQAARKMAAPKDGAPRAPQTSGTGKQVQVMRRLGRMVGRF